jgi:transposase
MEISYSYTTPVQYIAESCVLITNGTRHSDIADFIKAKGYPVSQSCVSNLFQKFRNGELGNTSENCGRKPLYVDEEREAIIQVRLEDRYLAAPDIT